MKETIFQEAPQLYEAHSPTLNIQTLADNIPITEIIKFHSRVYGWGTWSNWARALDANEL